MDDENPEKPFCVERAKQGRAACKKCKEKCLKDELRLAKLAPSPYGAGKMKIWHHVDCLFEQFLKQRATTRRLESSDELDGWDVLTKEDQDLIEKKFIECEKLIAEKYGFDYEPKNFVSSNRPSTSTTSVASTSGTKLKQGKDDLFKEFRRLVANITNVSSYLDKTELVNKQFTKGSNGDGFEGDILLWCKFLLPGVIKRIYNLQSKQLVKLFSRIFVTDQNDMLEHLEQGDIGETIQEFFEKSGPCKPASKSALTIREVDDFLQNLSRLTKEEDQINHMQLFVPKCTGNDLKVIVRLIKHDLRMNAGAKHILDGVHPDAYEAYQSSRDLKLVIDRCFGGAKNSITLLTPVLPMLAEPCKSITQAMKRCPNGMYSEIKYDGERVQVHKKGDKFKYFSRSLKPVLQHKISHFKDYIPKAFPRGEDLILDSEILMVDTTTGQPLPFGTLGSHKKTGLQNATVCLFVFDCIYFNGEDLTSKPLEDRKRILKDNMTEIKNHIMFSELNVIDEPAELAKMISHVLKLGLEGLVLKDVKSVYEPGKRHWLKVKKDYLFGGAIADSADLIVLGAWYGTGKKGGMMSVFLMGVHDPDTKKFCTVTKVHTGHDDKTLEKLQDELEMTKISKDFAKVPKWLKCTKTMVPDFVATDPKNQPIWEITGAEFTQQHDVHTANGISIRFPRVSKIRDDKTWETATNLKELNVLFENSKENFDVSLFDKELKDLASTDIKKYVTKKNTQTKRKRDTSTSSAKKDPSTKRDPSASPSKKLAKTEAVSQDYEQEPKMRKVEIVNPLPNYFDGVTLKLQGDIARDFAELLRVFVAYGGTIVEEEHSDLATHVLHNTDCVSEADENCSKDSVHVTCKWIVESISNGDLVDPFKFAVKLSGNYVED